MEKKYLITFALAWILLPGTSTALTIPEVQYSDLGHNWQSTYYDELSPQVVDVTGGVVTYAANPPGKSFARVVIQDPNFSEWAGIEIKIMDATPASAFGIGDRVDFTNVRVDESRGATYLLFDGVGYGSALTIISSGHVVEPTVVNPSLLGAGDLSADPGEAEKYEGMLLKVENVTLNVDENGLGSHCDNYELVGLGGTCWAADYMNVDRQVGEDYHYWVQTGRNFEAVVGILEQYTKPSSGYDYYQLLTRNSGDFVPAPTPAALLLVGGAALLGRRKKR